MPKYTVPQQQIGTSKSKDQKWTYTDFILQDAETGMFIQNCRGLGDYKTFLEGLMGKPGALELAEAPVYNEKFRNNDVKLPREARADGGGKKPWVGGGGSRGYEGKRLSQEEYGELQVRSFKEAFTGILSTIGASALTEMLTKQDPGMMAAIISGASAMANTRLIALSQNVIEHGHAAQAAAAAATQQATQPAQGSAPAQPAATPGPTGQIAAGQNPRADYFANLIPKLEKDEIYPIQNEIQADPGLSADEKGVLQHALFKRKMSLPS